MSITVVRAGMQTSVQGSGFAGQRHQAMPEAGAADPLSLALANRLVGKPLGSASLEITLGHVQLRANEAVSLAVTGAECSITHNELPARMHNRIDLLPGDVLDIGPARTGCRSYVALSRDLDLPWIMGSQSTCLTTGIGGLEGRALRDGDLVPLGVAHETPQETETPRRMRPYMSSHVVLRVVEGPEAHLLTAGLPSLTKRPWRISRRSNRMGLKLEGGTLDIRESGSMPSSAVFPGTIQCPADGVPYLLGPEGQTSGGYPRIAQVIRADRHLIGQLSDVDIIRLLPVSEAQARHVYIQKLELWQEWLPGLTLR